MPNQRTTLILDQQAIDTIIYRLIRKTMKMPSGCVEWIGCRDTYGYGSIALPGMKGNMLHVHRASYELFVGPIGEGLQVLHRCDNPSCVAPSHLFSGTQADNMKDMARKGRATTYRREFGRSKITKQVATWIVAECRAGRTHESVAKQLGLTRSHVSKITRGEKWQGPS